MASWKKDYYGSVAPTSDGFDATSGDTVDSTICNVRAMGDGVSWFEWDDDAGATNARFEATGSTTAVFAPVAATGITLYLVVQVVTNQFTIVIDTGTAGYRHTLTIQTGTLDLGGQTSSQDFQRPRKVRITCEGATWKAYIDESDTAIATLTATTATTAALLRFGTVTANAKVLLYELAWSESGALLASEFAAPNVATTYCTPQDVRDYLGLPTDAVGDAVVAKIVRSAEYAVDEAFFGADYSRTKLTFSASQTETNEHVNYAGAELFRLRYPYITAISALSYRSSSDLNSWTALNVGDISGYIASDRDLEQGVVRIPVTLRFLRRAAAFRVTYTHGTASVPLAVRELCVMKAALHVYNATLQHGAADVFDSRRRALESLIKDRESKIAAERVAWRVV